MPCIVPVQCKISMKWLNAKNHNEALTYPDDSLVEILKPTYGVIVYQEQVMLVASKMAGFSLGQADILRRR